MAQEYRERVGQAIRARRKAVGMGPTDFSQEMHVSVKTIERWERGETDGALPLIDKIADVLETDVLTLTCWPKEDVAVPVPDPFERTDGPQLDRIEKQLQDIQDVLLRLSATRPGEADDDREFEEVAAELARGAQQSEPREGTSPPEATGGD